MGEIKVNGYVILDDRRYTETDEWVKLEDDVARVGITDYAQKKLKDIVAVELPEKGVEVKAGESVAVVESIKSVADIYAPLDGTIVEVNEALLDQPELINDDPYGEGWIFALKVGDESKYSELLTAGQYAEKIRKAEQGGGEG